MKIACLAAIFCTLPAWADSTLQPREFVNLGASAPAGLLVVEKKWNKLSYYRSDKGDFQLVKSYHAFTGKKAGRKEVEGDMKTPEGVYWLQDEIPSTQLNERYGTGAFALNYPNIFDKLASKSGQGIWLHGRSPTDEGGTRGCVALDNADLNDLRPYLTPHHTPILIVNEITYVTSMEEWNRTIGDVVNFLQTWKAAWEQGDFPSYSQFYAASFPDRSKWLQFKEQVYDTAKNQVATLTSQPFIFSYAGQTVVAFQQEDGAGQILSLRRQGSQYEILDEVWLSSLKHEPKAGAAPLLSLR